MELSMTCAEGLFDGDAIKDGLMDLEGKESISQKALIEFRWKESCNNFVKAKKGERLEYDSTRCSSSSPSICVQK